MAIAESNPQVETLRVIFADNDEDYLTQMSELLRSNPKIDLVGVAHGGEEFLTLANKVTWDVALLDVAMPDLDGIAALKQVLRSKPEATVLMLTAFERPETLREALSAGAKGFLTKETRSDEVVSAIIRAYNGTTVMDSKPMSILTDFYVQANPAVADQEFAEKLNNLPDHLRKIADLLALAYTNREIAKATKLSEASVGTYVRNLIAELGCRRGEIAIKMMQLGLTPEQPDT